MCDNKSADKENPLWLIQKKTESFSLPTGSLPVNPSFGLSRFVSLWTNLAASLPYGEWCLWGFSLLLLSLHGSCAFLQHLPGVLWSLGTPLQKETPVPQGKELPPISHLVPVSHTLLTRTAGTHQSEMERKQSAKGRAVLSQGELYPKERQSKRHLATATLPALSVLLLKLNYRNLNTTSDTTTKSTQ